MRETVGTKPAWVVEKERKARRAREVKQRAPHPKMETPKRKDPVTIATRLDTLLVLVQRRKSQSIRIPVVDSIYTA